MNKKSIFLILLLILVIGGVGFFAISKKALPLISPRINSSGGGDIKQTVKPDPLPAAQTPSYNPPKEVRYGSSTDLKQELDSINPQVLDSDFE